MKTKSLIESFNYAVSGIVYALKHERNIKIHFIVAIIVLFISMFMDFTKIEMLILVLTISLVIMAEIFNTAIERTVNLVTDRYHPLAKAAKDVAAGAVLVTAVNAIVVGYLLFFDRLANKGEYVIFKLKASPTYLTFMAILLTIFLVITIKTRYQELGGTPFQGGIVSGHSAISFCISTIILLVSHNILIGLLAYALALIVAESRVEGKIHSLKEVIYGAMLGIAVGLFLFRFFI